jgi:hypothetical protein
LLLPLSFPPSFTVSLTFSPSFPSPILISQGFEFAEIS